MGWKPRKSGEQLENWDVPRYPEERASKSTPGQSEADKRTRADYSPRRINKGQSQEPWEAGDTGEKGQLNDV